MNCYKTPKGTELPMLDLRGKPYLQVAHRLVWFREEHPQGTIETQIVFRDENSATVKAEIKLDGKLLAMAHKTEDRKGFADFLEKAETGAIGRAPAMCGFGTQFAPEFDEGERLADSPIQPAKPAKSSSGTIPIADFLDRVQKLKDKDSWQKARKYSERYDGKDLDLAQSELGIKLHELEGGKV